jgi:lipopolysaccharide transport system ATP-binding protein
MKPIIKVEKLSKRYLIGEAQHSYSTLRESLSNAVRAPFKRNANNSKEAGNVFWALKDISFEVHPGEIVGIIGRNGAGKSTLLKLLSRITEPTTGRAELYGRVGSLLEVGTGFHPELTGRENIFLNGSILGMSQEEIASRFDEIVAFAEMEKFLDTPVKRYSSGMYMRLAFAVAAHLESEILVVDEVLAVGDAKFQKKCLDKMQDVGEHGRTVLFVSHNMSAVTRLCQRAILLDDGQVVKDDRSDRVASFYLRSGLASPAAREWNDLSKAPGNELVRLCAVRVLNKASQISGTIDIREPIKIEIEYYNYANDRNPYANIQLFDENGICIFASGDFTNMSWRHQPRRFTGRVNSSCTIPGNFLSEGQVTVLVALTTQNPSEMLAIEPDVVSFLVVDNSQGDGARGEYVGAFPGVVRPLLDWQVNCKSEV